MIKAENLVKNFGAFKAVDDISFEVKEGENLIILGKSGCGKTTTLRMINRLIAPDSGTVFIRGIDTAGIPAEKLRQGIGYVIQNHGLFPHYTVAENVAIVPRLFKWTDAAIHERMEELFAKLKLNVALKNRYPGELSGGQQQRVGLARSLMVNPPVLLMDEPFGALDNLTRVGIRKEFLALDELIRKTIVMVTHDVQEAFELGDRICLMDRGKIIQIGTPEELLFRPQSEFVSEFFREQRFQLELKAVKLCEILPASGVDPSLSVWDQMERLLTRDEADTDTEGPDIEHLMCAFSAFKKR
jgi:osmoprotectant transport system ATP-binding protein